jgi:hypothetical protein
LDKNFFFKVDDLATLSWRESFSSFFLASQIRKSEEKQIVVSRRTASTGFLPTDGFLRLEDFEVLEDVGLRPDEGHARPADGNSKKW